MDHTCVCCGAVIPEGRQVCPHCENAIREPAKTFGDTTQVLKDEASG